MRKKGAQVGREKSGRIKSSKIYNIIFIIYFLGLYEKKWLRTGEINQDFFVTCS